MHFRSILDTAGFWGRRMRFRFKALGAVSVEGPRGAVPGGALQPRRVAVLSLLAGAPSGTRSRDEIVGRLWPDVDQTTARHRLSDAVYGLRRALGSEAIVSLGDEELRLDPAAVWTDVRAFGEAMERGDLEEAVELYGGAFLEGFHVSGAREFERWRDRTARRLASRYGDALESLATMARSEGRPEEAVRWWRARAAHDPHDSRAAHALMLALAATGNPAAALRHARRHERALREELDLDVPREIRELARKLRAGERPSGEALWGVARRSPVSGGDRAGSAERPAESGRGESAHDGGGGRHGGRVERRTDFAVSPPWSYAAATVVVLVLTGILLTLAGLSSREAAPPRIVLADVRVPDPGGHAADLAGAVTEALRFNVNRSPVARVADRALVREALVRMEHPDGAPLDERTAFELAVREGIPLVLAGEVTRAGTGYVISARLLSAPDGSSLASLGVTAEDEEHLIGALDTLGRRIRTQLGESARSVRESRALDRVTTSSLRALELYSAGMRAHFREGAQVRALSLFREAIHTDSQFAGAHLMLAVATFNGGGSPDDAIGALRRAYELRDRLPLPERHLTGLEYHFHVSHDYRKVIEAGQNYLAVEPSDYASLIMVGEAHGALGHHRRAETYNLRAIEAGPARAFVPYGNVAVHRMNRGDYAGARAILEKARALGVDHPWRVSLLADIAANEGDFREAEDLLRRERDNRPDGPFARAVAARKLAEYATVQGRVGEALDRYEEAMRAAAGAGAEGQYLVLALERASLHLILRRDTAAALAAVDAALERRPLHGLAPGDRPYVRLVDLLARAGDVDRASELLTELLEVRSPPTESSFPLARSFVALAEGRFGEGLKILGSVDFAGCSTCRFKLLGWAYDRAGMSDSALANYRRLVETPHVRKFSGPWSAAGVPVALERLGDLYAARGEREEARRYYGRFVELWESCDPELRPRVRRARERMAGL